MHPKRAARGFSLIEMMVALVVGLIVSAAAVAFLVSIAKVNKENLEVTRVTQELRSVSEVINRELRRARYVSDPIGNIAQGGLGVPQVNDTISITANCISVAYDRPPTESTGTTRRTIFLGSDGRVRVSNGASCAATGTGEPISSPEVLISSLSFDNDADTTNALAPVEDLVRTTVSGRLRNAVGDMTSLTRTFRQDAYIRSGKVN
jgi:prepilin-type N-terminal cleavage/methylation domain-containing protein